MLRSRWPWIAVVVVAAALVVVAPWNRGEPPAAAARLAPDYAESFWEHWGDGRAELAGYELTYSRYGEPRAGTAVTIFVTETFASGPRVKSEDPGRNPAETFPVLKLNLIQDFPTGIYDYNLMTSAFVALVPTAGRPAGRSTKVSFSSQEWCGQVYAQLLFDRNGVRLTSHSYFDGEADRDETLHGGGDGLAEDALLLWARGLAGPLLEPGASLEVRLLRSLERARLQHLPVEWETATLARSAGTSTIRVPAGTFEVEQRTVTVAPSNTHRTYPPTRAERGLPERSWTFLVETAPPHRLVRWSRSDGAQATLVGSARLQYWAMNGPGLESALEQIGLRPRTPRTP